MEPTQCTLAYTFVLCSFDSCLYGYTRVCILASTEYAYCVHKLVSIHTCVELLVLAHIKNEPQRTEPTSPHPNPAGWFHERGRSWSEAGKTATGQLDHIGTTRWGHRRRGGGYRRTAAERHQPHRQRHQQQHRSGRNGIRKKPGTFFTARPTVVQDVQLL